MTNRKTEGEVGGYLSKNLHSISDVISLILKGDLQKQMSLENKSS